MIRRPARAGRRRPWRRDDGALTPMVVVFAAAIFMMIGLAVDGAGKLQALERATDLAQEAARAGGQALNLAQAVPGNSDVVNPDLARAAAIDYLSSAGVSSNDSTVTVDPSLTRLTVSVSIVYHPIFLGLVLTNDNWTETGTATAVLVVGPG